MIAVILTQMKSWWTDSSAFFGIMCCNKFCSWSYLNSQLSGHQKRFYFQVEDTLYGLLQKSGSPTSYGNYPQNTAAAKGPLQTDCFQSCIQKNQRLIKNRLFQKWRTRRHRKRHAHTHRRQFNLKNLSYAHKVRARNFHGNNIQQMLHWHAS